MKKYGSNFVAGDIHGRKEDMLKLSKAKFPEQNSLTKEDVLILLGDFGLIWFHDEHPKYKRDRALLKELSEANFSTCFVDGNHENFDELYEFPLIEKYGGTVREVYPGIYWLQRGQIYKINGKTFFAMGGARSDKEQESYNFKNFKTRYQKPKKQKSWWKQEIPSKEEFDLGIKNLSEANWKVDYVISHTCPTEICKDIFHKSGIMDHTRLEDPISLYFDEIEDNLNFKEWHFGHHHQDITIETTYGKFQCHYSNKPYLLN